MAGNDGQDPFGGPGSHETWAGLLDEGADGAEVSVAGEGRRYEVRHELARGGLGRILVAWDRQLQRPVALKALHERASGAARARFGREAMLTAGLEHPSIVPVHDSGVAEDGEPFLVMKLVDGMSLDAAVAERPNLQARLELVPHVIDACDALAYAHSRGVIHRDIKPENVLVGAFGETVVIDWGLAKALDGPDLTVEEGDDLLSGERAASLGSVGSGSLTRVGSVVGTPSYMAPEQATAKEVDARTDVYALGALLYTVLAGRPPYVGATAAEIVSAVISGPPVAVEQVEPGVPRDLSAIVARAMTREPAGRYPDARTLAADLKRFQTGQLVDAYHYGPVERVVRWVRQRPAIAGMAALVLAVVGVSFAGVVGQRNLAREARVEAEDARAREQARADEVTVQQARLALVSAPQRSLVLLAQVSAAFPDTELVRTLAADALSRPLPRVLRGADSDTFSADLSPSGRLLLTGAADGQTTVWDLEGGSPPLVLPGDGSGVATAVFSPDGSRIATAAGSKARIFETSTGRLVTTLDGHAGALQDVYFSPDGSMLVTASIDSTTRLWTADGAPLHDPLEHGAMLYDAKWVADGSTLATSAHNGRVRLFDTATGAQIWETDVGVEAYEVVPSPDGKWVVSINRDPPALVLDARTGEVVRRLAHGGWGQSGVFTDDGSWFYLSSSDERIRGYSFADPSAVPRELAVDGVPSDLEISADGTQVLTGTARGEVWQWEPETGERTRLPGFPHQVMAVAFARDGSLAVAGGAHRDLTVWDLDQVGGVVLRGHEGRAHVVVAADRDRIVSVGDDGVRRWAWREGTSELVRLGEDRGFHGVELADGTWVASSAEGGLWLVEPAGPAELLLDTGSVRCRLAAHPVRPVVGLACADGLILAFDVAAREVLRREALGRNAVRPAFSPDGALLAVGMVGQIALVNVELPELPVEIRQEHESVVAGVDWVGNQLLSCAFDDTVRLWSEDRSTHQALPGRRYQPTAVLAGPGNWVLAGDGIGGMTAWSRADLTTGITLRGHTQYVNGLVAAPKLAMAASYSWDQTARLWSFVDGGPHARPLLGHQGNVGHAKFFADGSALVTASDDGTIRVWEDRLPHEPDALRAVLSELAAAVERGERPRYDPGR